MPPSAKLLLNQRVADHLHNPAYFANDRDPDWTPGTVQRVITAIVTVVLDAVANGEEIQIGNLGSFVAEVKPERTVAVNLPGASGEKIKTLPRATLTFKPTPQAEKQAATVLEKVKLLEK